LVGQALEKQPAFAEQIEVLVEKGLGFGQELMERLALAE